MKKILKNLKSFFLNFWKVNSIIKDFTEISLHQLLLLIDKELMEDKIKQQKQLLKSTRISNTMLTHFNSRYKKEILTHEKSIKLNKETITGLIKEVCGLQEFEYRYNDVNQLYKKSKAVNERAKIVLKWYKYELEKENILNLETLQNFDNRLKYRVMFCKDCRSNEDGRCVKLDMDIKGYMSCVHFNEVQK